MSASGYTPLQVDRMKKVRESPQRSLGQREDNIEGLTGQRHLFGLVKGGKISGKRKALEAR